MVLKKAIISVFLLLTYSMGLAHEVIPHCHHNTVGPESNGHHVVDHQHDLGHVCEKESAHFDHRAHCDEGFMNFVVCLMSETDHPDTCNERSLFLPSLTHDLSSNQGVKLLITAAILLTSYDFFSLSACKQTFADPSFSCFPRASSPASLRGPPSISC